MLEPHEQHYLVMIYSIVSTIFGGCLSSWIAKSYIKRTVQTIEDQSTALQQIKTTLAVIGVKLDAIDKLNSLVFEHDRRITVLESKRHANGRASTSVDT